MSESKHTQPKGAGAPANPTSTGEILTFQRECDDHLHVLSAPQLVERIAELAAMADLATGHGCTTLRAKCPIDACIMDTWWTMEPAREAVE